MNFPEAYMRGDIKIENASLLEFLYMTFDNIGRSEINFSGYIIKKILHLWRICGNYNFPGNSNFPGKSHFLGSHISRKFTFTGKSMVTETGL